MRNSEALWRLSMLLRQLPPDANKRVCESLIAQSDEALSELLTANSQAVDGLSLSLRLAHAAVKAAPTSGRAWECLGNALLTAFLSDQPAKTAGFITRSLAAFAQALKDPAVASEPHFHYNRAAALHYQVNINLATSPKTPSSACFDGDSCLYVLSFSVKIHFNVFVPFIHIARPSSSSSPSTSPLIPHILLRLDERALQEGYTSGKMLR